MKWIRFGAAVLLTCVVLCAVFATKIAPFSYERQFREVPNAAPGAQFLMGTDEIGRDRFSRLIYATRVSVVLAPAASVVSIVLALLISVLASARAHLARPAVFGLTTICLSMPWIFLFIILRAELPLDTGPFISILLTFGLMGVAGWAWPARVFAASIEQVSQSEWLIQARASGLREARIAVVYVWPHLRAIALAQFRVLAPAYILSEASLGLLGLGVADPVPSWGNLLQDLQHPDLVKANPWVLAPLGLLVVVMVCLEALGSAREAYL